METVKITTLDVMDVANRIHQLLTNNEILQILNQFDEAAEKDCCATWDLVIENLIYDIKK